jgi:SM-20-related protein
VSTDLQQGVGRSTVLARGLRTPHLVLRDFLDPAVVADLLDYAVSRESDFTPTLVVKSYAPAATDALDRSIQTSPGLLNDLGPFRQMFEARILGLLPVLIAQLRIKAVDEPSLETHLSAHGDGAFLTRHIDTRGADYHKDRVRVLSGVYYFNAEPKAFSGGALRLHAIGGKAGENFVDIEPEHNSLLVAAPVAIETHCGWRCSAPRG